MSKDAQLTLTMPDRLMPMAGLNRTQADPAAGAATPQALELRHLRYFVALADAGSFTRPAEQIFIAQPTLSQQIRRLGPPASSSRQGERLSPGCGEVHGGSSWRTSRRSRPSASISASTPYSADRSRNPLSTVSALCRRETNAGNADSTVAPRWPLIRISYRADAGSMRPWSGTGR